MSGNASSGQDERSAPAPRRRSSGLEQVPPFLTRPIWKDRIFWIGIAQAAFWAAIIWYFFF